MNETPSSLLHLTCRTDRGRPKAVRHAVEAFLNVFDIAEDARTDISTAVGEALINVVEHAYAPGDAGVIDLTARFTTPDTLVVEVRDDGSFKESSGQGGARGFGLHVIEAIAERVSIERDPGTCVTMQFAAPPQPPSRRIA